MKRYIVDEAWLEAMLDRVVLSIPEVNRYDWELALSWLTGMPEVPEWATHFASGLLFADGGADEVEQTEAIK